LVQGVALPLDEALDQRMLGKLTEQVENLAFEYAWVQARAGVESRPDDPWHEFARTLLRLRTLFQRAGDETVAIWRSTPARSLSLLCRDPSWILGPVFDGVFASVCMSATLAPASYYRDMMGLVPARTVSVDVESPFPPENSRFVLLPEVSTEYRHRQRDRHSTADLISRAIGNIPGNVAVFFPSFSLMESVAPLLDLAGRPVLQQARFMDDQARDDLLQQLMLGRGHLLLAVMGGIFGEGVDFAGDALNGAVIVGPGLPTVNLERRLMESWFQSRYEKGHQYAWLVPGMCRVVQAAGRVVRSADEKGAIVLVGRRFLLREIQDLLPTWWFLRRTRRPEEELVGFWESAVE